MLAATCLLFRSSQSFPLQGWWVCSCARRRTHVPYEPSDCPCASEMEAAYPFRLVPPHWTWTLSCGSAYVTSSSIDLLLYCDAVELRSLPASIKTFISKSLLTWKGVPLSTFTLGMLVVSYWGRMWTSLWSFWSKAGANRKQIVWPNRFQNGFWVVCWRAFSNVAMQTKWLKCCFSVRKFSTLFLELFAERRLVTLTMLTKRLKCCFSGSFRLLREPTGQFVSLPSTRDEHCPPNTIDIRYRNLDNTRSLLFVSVKVIRVYVTAMKTSSPSTP